MGSTTGGSAVILKMINYNIEYISRIYEPYVYLMTNDGPTEIELKGGEIITLFHTPEGAVKYFDLVSHRPAMTVEDYYSDPNPLVDHVKVAVPGKYTVVDITNNHVYGVKSNMIYGQFFRNPKLHTTYGEYIGWAYFQPGMVCQYCGGDTTRDDMEYLSGNNHLNCELSFHA